MIEGEWYMPVKPLFALRICINKRLNSELRLPRLLEMIVDTAEPIEPLGAIEEAGEAVVVEVRLHRVVARTEQRTSWWLHGVSALANEREPIFVGCAIERPKVLVGSGDGENKEDKNLTVHVTQIIGERNEVHIDRQQHELNGHEQNDQIAAV